MSSIPDTVLRATFIYIFLLVTLRLAGRRTLAQASPFDLVLLLIVSEATQQVLVQNDSSYLTAAVSIGTLVSLDVLFGRIKQYFPRLEKLLEGEEVYLMKGGRLLHDRLDRYKVNEGDLIATARQVHGLRDLSKVNEAVLEADGTISLVLEAGDA
jgi:uncharacterized membrane protein YcaP (DUF421 family)